MIKLVLICFLLFSATLFGQSFNIDSLIQQVEAVSGEVAKQQLTDAFVEQAHSVGIPIIQGNKVTFIYRGKPGFVSLGGDHNNWQGSFKKPLKHIDSTNFHYQVETFETYARFEYAFLVDDNWYPDVENPRMGSRFSELAMPDYIYPWETELIDSTNKGQIVSTQLKYFANDIEKEYNISVYLPYGYDAQANDTYPAVYFQDGSWYLRYADVKNILDNLIHFKKIEPVIAVFVDPYNRGEEYLASQKNTYAQFFTTHLVNYVDSVYTTDNRASKRLVMGPSYGGNISAYISYHYDYIFANCGLNSAAFRPSFDVYNLITNGIKKDVSYYAVWGTYEYPIYVDMRAFRTEVQNLGYSFVWGEYPEGHSFGFWKAHIDDIIIHFFPYMSTVDIFDDAVVPQLFSLKQNYPNPFNPSTIISYQLSVNSNVKLIVYDVLGREVQILVNKKQSAGEYQATFDATGLASGIYYYRLTVGDSPGRTGHFIQTRKMLLLR